MTDSRALRPLLLFGLLPLPWFLAWVFAAGALVSGYDPVSRHASELSLIGGLPALLLTVAAVGSGVAFILFAVGLWLDSKRPVAFGALTTAIFGASMLSNGIWTMGSPLHGLYGAGIVNLVAPALVLCESKRLSQDRLAYAATIVASLAGVFYLWLNLTGHDIEQIRGLTQRIFSSIYSAWAAIIALRLLRRRGPGPSRTAAA